MLLFIRQLRVCSKHVKIKFSDNIQLRFSSAWQASKFDSANENQNEKKILKVAIIGVPNAGKSTLINQIVGRNVFAVSKKVHTTRCRAKAVMVDNETQIVFLDTPGLVSLQEGKKFKLEQPCIADSEEAVKEADVIGVIQDAANKYTRERLDPKVLRLLYLYPQKHSILILNKVDIMKCKRDLLDLARDLSTTNNTPIDYNFLDDRISLKESDLQRLGEETGWPNFKEIFMVSALNGDGVADIRIYLLRSAKPGEWMYERTTITDQDDVKVIENTVFSKLLEFLPNVVPYKLKVSLEYFNVSQDGSVNAVVLIGCKKLREQKFVMGKGGGRMKEIALGTEQDLRRFYLNDVRVKLVLVDETEINKVNIFTEPPPMRRKHFFKGWKKNNVKQFLA